jgi:hypothetical protein
LMIPIHFLPFWGYPFIHFFPFWWYPFTSLLLMIPIYYFPFGDTHLLLHFLCYPFSTSLSMIPIYYFFTFDDTRSFWWHPLDREVRIVDKDKMGIFVSCVFHKGVFFFMSSDTKDIFPHMSLGTLKASFPLRGCYKRICHNSPPFDYISITFCHRTAGGGLNLSHLKALLHWPKMYLWLWESSESP